MRNLPKTNSDNRKPGFIICPRRPKVGDILTVTNVEIEALGYLVTLVDELENIIQFVVMTGNLPE